MSSLEKLKQGIKIKTTTHPHSTAKGVERASRVKILEAKPGIVKLGVRIRNGQTITVFKLDRVDMMDGHHPIDPAVGSELNLVDRFKMDGETWVGWTIQEVDLPGNLSNFRTEFGLNPPDLDGQTLMWAVTYTKERFDGDHVYVGYADVTPP